MLKLRLYKTPYIDPMFPNLVRLLFEGRFIENKAISYDFYIYVWLNRLGYFKGFQAVLDERITLAFHMSSKRFFGKLARDIIDRGITKAESPEEREKILNAINEMSNNEFAGLLGAIIDLAKGGAVTEVKLSDREMKVFSKILKEVLL